MTNRIRRTGGSVLAGAAVLAAIAVQPTAADASGYVGTDAAPPPAALSAVTAISADDVWAVGTRAPQNGPWRLFTTHWDGSTWTSVPPNGPGGDGVHQLVGVDATSTNDVWAVGYYTRQSDEHPLVEHWNGTAWSVVDIPEPADGGALFDVTALSPTNVWAVGRTSSVVLSHKGLIEHWDGTAWHIVPNPAGDVFSELTSVSASGPLSVWAVGYRVDQNYSVLAEHWNGQKWALSDTPEGPERDNYLSGVAVIAPHNVWSVGSDFDPEGALIEHFNGTTWSQDNLDAVEASFNSVGGISSHDVWAVGTIRHGFQKTLAAHWNGSAWTVVPTPNPGPKHNTLSDVSALGTNDVWAVGTVDNDQRRTGLIEHWDGSHWTSAF